jgi:hypothetical protein
MTLKEFAQACFYAGKRREQTKGEEEPEPNFGEWWRDMQTCLEANKILISGGVSCCNCQQELKGLSTPHTHEPKPI